MILSLVLQFTLMENARIVASTVEHCQKYASHQKKLLIKVVCNWISYVEVYKRIITHWSGARGLERYPSLKYYYVEKQKSRFTLELHAAKKKASHQKKVQINAVWNWISTKSPRAHMSDSSQSWPRRLERYPSLE